MSRSNARHIEIWIGKLILDVCLDPQEQARVAATARLDGQLLGEQCRKEIQGRIGEARRRQRHSAVELSTKTDKVLCDKQTQPLLTTYRSQP